MKGVVLAGGLGTRLLPLTKVTNKHLLPVYNKPMIYYPILTIINAGIKEVMIVTGGNSAGDFLRLLGNGKEFGLKEINYTYQEGEGGIAEALALAEDFADGEKILVVLGDNVIEKNIKKYKESFEKQKQGAKILLKEVPHPQHFGVPVFKRKTEDVRSKTNPKLNSGQVFVSRLTSPVSPKILRIEEKPKNPKSKYAVTGIYMYDSRVFDIIKTLERSDRGELEITDVNNDYIEHGTMTHDILDGWWIDAGSSPDNLALATQLVIKTGANKTGNSQ